MKGHRGSVLSITLVVVVLILLSHGGGSEASRCHLFRYISSGLLNCKAAVAPGSTESPSAKCCSAVTKFASSTSNPEDLCQQVQCLVSAYPSHVTLEEILGLPSKCGFCNPGSPFVGAQCAGQTAC